MEFKESNRNRNRIFRLGFKNFRTKTYKSLILNHLIFYIYLLSLQKGINFVQ